MPFPYQLIDLTHPLDSAIPTWQGGCGFRHHMQVDYADCQGDDTFRVMTIAMQAGIGTHMDAPSHCIPGGRNIDDFSLQDLILPCVVIDITDKCHARYDLSEQDIQDFEHQFGTLPKGACVLVKTGWGQYWATPAQYHNQHIFPAVSASAATLLLQREVGALGIDTLSPDRPEAGFKVHKAFLGANKFLIENGENLAHMPPTGGFVMVLPLKIKAGTEAPVRLVGLVKL